MIPLFGAEEGDTMAKARFDLPPTLFQEEEEVPTALLKWAGAKMTPSGAMAPREKKNRTKTVGASVFARARAEVEAMMKTGEWKEAGARHLVALYAVLHQEVYGVEALELTPSACYLATLQAGMLVKKHFGGDIVVAVEFMKWVWEREQGLEAWRKSVGRETRRIGPRWMFTGAALVTDYRARR